MSTVAASITVSGDVSEYDDPTTVLRLRAMFAGAASVTIDRVAITVTAASVGIRALITIEAAAVATAATALSTTILASPAAAEAALAAVNITGVAVAAVSAPVIADAGLAADEVTGSVDAEDKPVSAGAVVAIVIGCLALGLLAAATYYYWRAPTTATSEVRVEPKRTRSRRPPPPKPHKPCDPAWWVVCFSCSLALVALVGCALWISVGYSDGLRPPSAPPPFPPPPSPSPPPS